MGSYSAPISAPVFVKEIVDNTTAINTVVMDFTCTRFLLNFQTSALWDGEIRVYYQCTDDTYKYTDNIAADVNRLTWIADANDNLTYVETPAAKYPYQIRVIVQAAATLGACTCWLTYEKRPSNPLF